MRINGRETDALDPRDRGLHYGDGVFETLAVVDAHPLEWQRHMRRLRDGCDRLRIPAPPERELREQALGEIAGRDSGVLKILVTRGVGGRGYRPPDQPHPTCLLHLYPPPQYPAEWREHGVRLRMCETRLSNNPRLAGVKHLNRLEQVLARAEWNEPRIAEGLVRDQSGHVIEATAANLFLVEGGRLITPRLDECGVAGIMRARVLDQARQLALPAAVEDVPEHRLAHADALFLTNSIIGCWPVRELSGRVYDWERHIPARLADWLMRQGLRTSTT